jgi:hypothetical protein
MNEGKRLRSPLDDSAGVDGTAGADKRARTCAVPANDITIATVNGPNGSGAAQADGAHMAADERETGAEEAAHSWVTFLRTRWLPDAHADARASHREGTPDVLNAQTSALVDAEDGAGDDMEMDSVDGDAAVSTDAGGLRALLGEELQPGVIMFGMVGGMGPRIVEKPTVDHRFAFLDCSPLCSVADDGAQFESDRRRVLEGARLGSPHSNVQPLQEGESQVVRMHSRIPPPSVVRDSFIRRPLPIQDSEGGQERRCDARYRCGDTRGGTSSERGSWS